MKPEALTFELNGKTIVTDTEPSTLLLDFLREALDLTGVKKGCDNEGQCGACTVIVNDRALRACLTPLAKVAGKRVITIEGLGTPEQLHPLQQAFIDHGAVQCGYCTPGIIMSAAALLNRNPNPARADVVRALQGNLCRCTGYVKIINAVMSAAGLLQGNRGHAPTDAPDAIGGHLRRQNAAGKVTGTTRYAGDMKLPGMLYAKVLRSPHPHALITQLDTRSALAVPGVRAVFTAADIPGVNTFTDELDSNGVTTRQKTLTMAKEPLLAIDRVRMIGEPIAILVAVDEASAAAGVEAIQVTFEVLEPIFDPKTAMLVSTPPLHPGGNIYEVDKVVKGDAQAALATAEVRVDACYTMPSQDHVTLEPESMVAYVAENGQVVVIGPTQQPHHRKQQIAAMLAIPPERVRVIMPNMGGSFGGRHYFWPVVAIALPAYLLRKPVKLVYTRQEVFAATVKRHPFQFNYQIGARPDGKLLSLHVQALGNAGPYGGAPSIAANVTQSGIGPYQWPVIDYETRVAHTNWANAGPFRGYGMPQGAFALECTLDELAGRLGVDPLALRRLNAVDVRQGNTLGQQFDEPFAFKQVLEVIEPEWAAIQAETATFRAGASGAECFGAGLAVTWYRFSKAGSTRVSAQAGLAPDGAIILYYTAVKMGQGVDTVISQLASHELGIPREALTLVNGDTDATLHTDVYGGSRTTYWIGGAIQHASRILKHAITSTASEMLDVSQEQLCLTGHSVYVRHSPEQLILLRDIATEWQRIGQPLKYTGSLDLTRRVPENTSNYALGHFVVGVTLAQVRVNLKNGGVKVLRVVVAQDVGRAINPVDLAGQIEGSVVMELGATLMEEYIPGQTLDFKRYHIPRIGDIPQIKTILVEQPGWDGPLGAKGVGEAVMGHIKAAIANAIFNASGVRIRQLPVTPEQILKKELLQK